MEDIIVPIIIAVLLSVFTLIRFVSGFKTEHYRQRMITWPRVPVRFLSEDHIVLLESHTEPSGEKVWLARFQNPYQFYLQGELFSGNQLLLNEWWLSEGEQREVTRQLNRKRHALTVAYNPADPTENALLVPYVELSWFSLPFYLVFGIVLPLVLQTDPASSSVVVFGVFLTMILLGGYMFIRSERHLKDLVSR